MKKSLLFISVLWLISMMSIHQSLAQNLTTPRPSPAAKFTQTVGLTNITIKYSRPSVNDREIWGKLVPYNEGNPRPWRAGANENTVIHFSDDVTIEGKALAAGAYGLHIIPAEDKATIIFSTNTSSWGSFFYNQSEDALRVDVKTKSCEHHEVLTYDVVALSNNEATIALSWADKRIPFKVGVDTHEITLANMRDELRSLPGFSWQGWNQAANYCLQNNINHEEAIGWADASIQRGANFTNMSTKSGLLAQTGKAEESKEIMDNALKVATNAELNVYGYQLLNQQKFDEAIKIFQMNVEQNPNDPNVHDSLGEGYVLRDAKGDKKLAIKSFKKSLSLNPPANVKANSMKYLKQLGVNVDDNQADGEE